MGDYVCANCHQRSGMMGHWRSEALAKRGLEIREVQS